MRGGYGQVPMRSVYVKILLWCLGTLILSLAGFVLVSRFVMLDTTGKGGPLEQLSALQLADARDAYESGGPQALARRLARLRGFVSAEYYLTDAHGRDLASGEDRSQLLATVEGNWDAPHRYDGHLVIATTTPDRRYCLIMLTDPPFDIWRFIPYCLLIFVAVALLCWVLAVSIASPLGHLTRAVERFGAGDLSVRTESARKDEIGELARAFDRMAGRITTLVTAERRLLQDVSHELRSPLARLRFAVQLSRREQDRDESAAQVDKEIDRLSELVGALMQVTRAEGDPSTYRPEPVELAPLLEAILEDCEYEAREHGCRLVPNIKSSPAVCGDLELLRRAIENVVENAIRYAPPDSAVELDLAVHGQSATISIRDYGPGVQEEDLTRIFAPFFRVDASRDDATGGVGLGLAIAMRAATLHHGEMRAENAQPGLRVILEIPRLAEPPKS